MKLERRQAAAPPGGSARVPPQTEEEEVQVLQVDRVKRTTVISGNDLILSNHKKQTVAQHVIQSNRPITD